MEELKPGNTHLILYLDEDLAIQLSVHEDDSIRDVLQRVIETYPHEVDGDMDDWEIHRNETTLDLAAFLKDFLEEDETSLEGARVTYEMRIVKRETVKRANSRL